GGKQTTTEAELGIRGYWDLERIGSKQIGANVRPYFTVDRDFNRYGRTYSEAGLATFLDAIGPFSLELSGSIAASSWPGANNASRPLGYHGSSLQLALMRDLPFGDMRHAEIMVGGGLNAPSSAIGSTTGSGTVRLKLLGPIFR